MGLSPFSLSSHCRVQGPGYGALFFCCSSQRVLASTYPSSLSCFSLLWSSLLHLSLPSSTPFRRFLLRCVTPPSVFPLPPSSPPFHGGVRPQAGRVSTPHLSTPTRSYRSRAVPADLAMPMPWMSDGETWVCQTCVTGLGWVGRTIRAPMEPNRVRTETLGCLIYVRTDWNFPGRRTEIENDPQTRSRSQQGGTLSPRWGGCVLGGRPLKPRPPASARSLRLCMSHTTEHATMAMRNAGSRATTFRQIGRSPMGKRWRCDYRDSQPGRVTGGR